MNERLKDYIDTNMLQKLQDGFANVTGMSSVTFCDSGLVTRISKPSEFSAKYSKDSALGGQEYVSEAKMIGTGRPSVYVTKTGLTEIAAAIVIGGKQLAVIVAGQVLEDSLSESKANRVADELGVDPKAFLKDLQSVPIISKSKINAASEFLFSIAQMVSSCAKKSSTQSQESNLSFTGDSTSAEGMLHNKLVEIDELIHINSVNTRKLYDSYDALSGIAQNSVKKLADTKDTVKSIQDIAMNTRILGFNASIEASRAKESGKGFGVIAQEVRSLADVSKSSTDKIDSIIQEIGVNTEEISNNIHKTESILRGNLEIAENIAQLLSEISSIANQIK